MGTVGINFGSASGGAGFDVTATVASIVGNLQAVESPWKTQLTSLKAQDTAFTSLGTDLSALSSSVSALTDFQGVMASKLGSSSDPNILSLGNASSLAVASSHTVIVKQLAQTSSQYSAVVPLTDKLSGGLTIQVGPTGTPRTIPAVSGVSDTLATYSAAINAAGIGVTASVISDTTGSRLSLVSGTSGAAGQLTITSGGTIPTSTASTTTAASVASTSMVAATNTFTLAASSDQLSGTFSYAVGATGAATVNLGATPLSLSDTANTLNSDIGFQSAGLVATFNGADLVITGATGDSGSSNIDTTGSSLTTTTPAVPVGKLTDATASPASTIAMKSALAGQDALLNVDGLDVDSASNSISTAISGVTFQLVSADPNTTVQIQIVNNNSSVEAAFSTLVTAYNKVVKDLSTQEGKDASGQASPLYGSTILSQIQSSLSLALTSGVAAGKVSNLAQLGVSVNTDGTLKLDSSALDSTLNSNYSDVVGFFQNTNSFGLNLQNSIDQLGSQSSTGAITLALASNSSQETTLNSDVTAQEALIAAQKTSLTAQLNLANEILQAIPQQISEVNQLYSSISGYNTGSH